MITPTADPPPAPPAPTAHPRRIPRWPLLFVAAVICGGATAGVGSLLVEEHAGRLLSRALAKQDCTVRWSSLHLLRQGALDLRGLTIERPGLGRLALKRARIEPLSFGDLLSGTAGSWRLEASDWRLEREQSGPGGLTLHGAGARLTVGPGELRLQTVGVLPDGRVLGLRATGRPRPTGARTLAVRFDPPLPVSTLLATGRTLLDSDGRGELPAALGSLTLGGASWDEAQATLTLERIDLGGPGGPGGSVERIEIGLTPETHAPRSMTLVQPRLRLGSTPPSPGGPVAPPPTAADGAAEDDAQALVRRIFDGLQGFDRPPLDQLHSVAVEQGELIRQGSGPATTFQLTEINGQLWPRQGIELSGRLRAHLGIGGRLHGSLAWPTWEQETVHLAGSLALDEGRIELAALAPTPVEGIAGRAEGTLDWRPGSGEVELQLERIEAPGGLQARLAFSGQRLGVGSPAVQATLFLPEQPCQGLADALPAGLAPLLEQMTLRGTMGGALHFGLDLALPSAPVTQLSLDPPALSGCAIVSLGRVGVERLASNFVQKLTIDVQGRQRTVEVGPGTPDYVPLQQVPAAVRRAMLVTENASFYGIGPLSLGLLRGALNLDLTHGRYVYGGSTITQQLVKNLFLTRHKHLSRKLQEALIAWRVEDVLSKDRILELYVNCIEFGPGIYGIERASRYYFGHGARELTTVEGVFLASIKPGPSDGPRIARGSRPRWWLEKMAKTLDRLAIEGAITPEEREAANPPEPVFHLAGALGGPALVDHGEAETGAAEQDEPDPDAAPEDEEAAGPPVAPPTPPETPAAGPAAGPAADPATAPAGGA